MTSAREPATFGAHQQQPYIDGRPMSHGGGGNGAAGHEDPYAAGGTTYPPAGAGMNGYHAAPLGTPVRVVTREREYANGGTGGVAALPPMGSTTMTSGAIAGTSLGQSQSMASDGQYKLRAKYV
jgi:hypothetical protein